MASPLTEPAASTFRPLYLALSIRRIPVGPLAAGTTLPPRAKSGQQLHLITMPLPPLGDGHGFAEEFHGRMTLRRPLSENSQFLRFYLIETLRNH